MNRKKRRSSRIRSLNRRRGRTGQIGTIPVYNASGKLMNAALFNRTAKREGLAWIQQQRGRSLKEAARNLRRAHKVKIRRALRVIRKELKQALRRGWA